MRSSSTSTKTKKFSKKLYRKYDKVARELAKSLVEKQYNMTVMDNPDTYGPDLMAYRDGEFRGYVECEVKALWKDKTFPFKTIQFPERKSKFIGDDPILFVMFNVSLDCCLAVDGCDLDSSPLREVSNKYMDKGERFYQVPTYKSKYFVKGDF